MEFMIYTPAWGGNREKENPFTVEIHLLTRREIQALGKQIKHKRRKGFREEFSDNSAEVQERQFLENVGRIEGFSHPLIKVPVTNAQELYDAPGCTTLVTEIIDTMEDASGLTEDEIKNSAPQSAGVSGQKSSDGTAKAAS